MQGTMEKSKFEKEQTAGPNKFEQKLIRTRTCALSNSNLEVGTPVVADELGNLFNKEALLTALVEKTLPPEFSHIRGMRDIVSCSFHKNPTPPPDGVDIDWSTDNWAPYSCPISGVEMNGRYAFVAFRVSAAVASEGGRACNVISEKALREMGAGALQAEYGPFDAESGVVKLVPSDVDRLAMVAALSSRREAEKARKAADKAIRKADKKQKRLAAAEGGRATEGVEEDEGEVSDRKAKKIKHAALGRATGVSLGATKAGSMVGAVMAEQRQTQAAALASSATLAGLFHGAGSQKPASAKDQFIVQSGKRGLLG